MKKGMFSTKHYLVKNQNDIRKIEIFKKLIFYFKLILIKDIQNGFGIVLLVVTQIS